MGYDPLSKTNSLQEFWVSRASAEQRKVRLPGSVTRTHTRTSTHTHTHTRARTHTVEVAGACVRYVMRRTTHRDSVLCVVHTFDNPVSRGYAVDAWQPHHQGRAGRTAPGVCFRLYSRRAFEAFPDYAPAEVHRVPLESVVLNIKALGTRGGDPFAFPFLQPPPRHHIEAALQHLISLGTYVVGVWVVCPVFHGLARSDASVSNLFCVSLNVSGASCC